MSCTIDTVGWISSEKLNGEGAEPASYQSTPYIVNWWSNIIHGICTQILSSRLCAFSTILPSLHLRWLENTLNSYLLFLLQILSMSTLSFNPIIVLSVGKCEGDADTSGCSLAHNQW